MIFPIYFPFQSGPWPPPDPQGRPWDIEVVMVLVLFASAAFAAWCVWHNVTMQDTFPLANTYPDIWDTETAVIIGAFFGFMAALFFQGAVIGMFLGIRTLWRAATRGIRR